MKCFPVFVQHIIKNWKLFEKRILGKALLPWDVKTDSRSPPIGLSIVWGPQPA